MRLDPTLVVALALLIATEAHGQNMREVPQGGRTSTMGGVGVAAGVDTAMPLLNPAGIAGTPTDMLSVSADVYSGTWLKIPRYFRPNGVDPKQFGNVTNVSEEDYSISEIDSTPSGVAYFMRLGPADAPNKHVLGVSFTAESYLLYNEVGSFGATTSTGSVREDVVVANQITQYLVGPSYAVHLSDRLRLGASVFATYGHLTNDAHRNTVFTQVTNGVSSPTSSNARTRTDATSFGITAVAGVQARVAKNMWIGGALESVGIPFYGSGDAFVNADGTSVDPAKGQLATHSNIHVALHDFQLRRPFRMSLGAAYEVPKSFSVGADLHAWFPQPGFIHTAFSAQSLTFQTGQPPNTQNVDTNVSGDTRFTLNGSLGGEVFVTDSIALRAGIATDRDLIDDQNNGQKSDRLDWYVATLGVGSYDGIFETTYGGAFRYGVGTRYVPDSFNSKSPVAVDYTGWGVMIILSGSVKLEKEKPKPKKNPNR
jgi:hypothetical protein